VQVSLPSASTELVAAEATAWRTGDVLKRLWAKDPTVWADPPVPETADRLGWLDASASSRPLISSIQSLHADAIENGITDIVLCGMGGSSLAPEVFAATLPVATGSPKLTVIDSTHPVAISRVASATSPASTWYIIASKSGGTIETMSLFRYFWVEAQQHLGNPGGHFIAITDPGTSLESLASERGFRATFLADSNVGGRYSALTAFGLVPTGLAGGDVTRLLDSAAQAARSCSPSTPLEANPGFGIGAVLAARARLGEDKAQFLCTTPVETIAIWIEQLIAESTGKEGVGIVPIGGGSQLIDDRGATVVGIGSPPFPDVDIEISVDDPYDVAGVMFVLEFATAVAGRCLGINPFDQPDVQLAKKLAATAMSGELSTDVSPPVKVSDMGWTEALTSKIAGSVPSYVSIQAYVAQTPETEARLKELRRVLTEASGAFVTVGFGPRFLHSTGQLHKGGPPGGLYLQIVNDTGDPLEVPESGFTFNELIAAQARGDRAALTDRDRAVIAVDLGADTDAGLMSMVERLSAVI
jgi:transaldolase/glucose-6-phosphate isomerase